MICSGVYVRYVFGASDNSLTLSLWSAFFDFNGPANFTDTFNNEDDDFTDMTVGAGNDPMHLVFITPF